VDEDGGYGIFHLRVNIASSNLNRQAIKTVTFTPTLILGFK